MTYTLDKINRILRDGEPTGSSVSRGAYYGTTDDKADRWYIVPDGGPGRRWGHGYANRKAALAAYAANDAMIHNYA